MYSSSSFAPPLVTQCDASKERFGFKYKRRHESQNPLQIAPRRRIYSCSERQHPMPHWLIKSAVHRVISWMPNPQSWNYLLSKYVVKSTGLNKDGFEYILQ